MSARFAPGTPFPPLRIPPSVPSAHGERRRGLAPRIKETALSAKLGSCSRPLHVRRARHAPTTHIATKSMQPLAYRVRPVQYLARQLRLSPVVSRVGLVFSPSAGLSARANFSAASARLESRPRSRIRNSASPALWARSSSFVARCAAQELLTMRLVGVAAKSARPGSILVHLGRQPVSRAPLAPSPVVRGAPSAGPGVLLDPRAAGHAAPAKASTWTRWSASRARTAQSIRQGRLRPACNALPLTCVKAKRSRQMPTTPSASAHRVRFFVTT